MQRTFLGSSVCCHPRPWDEEGTCGDTQGTSLLSRGGSEHPAGCCSALTMPEAGAALPPAANPILSTSHHLDPTLLLFSSWLRFLKSTIRISSYVGSCLTLKFLPITIKPRMTIGRKYIWKAITDHVSETPDGNKTRNSSLESSVG